MSEERTVKKVFKNTAEGKRSIGKTRKRWLDDVENDLKKMGVSG
jgi:DNA-binding PadR family transcriptional regulator